VENGRRRRAAFYAILTADQQLSTPNCTCGLGGRGVLEADSDARTAAELGRYPSRVAQSMATMGRRNRLPYLASRDSIESPRSSPSQFLANLDRLRARSLCEGCRASFMCQRPCIPASRCRTSGDRVENQHHVVRRAADVPTIHDFDPASRDIPESLQYTSGQLGCDLDVARPGFQALARETSGLAM